MSNYIIIESKANKKIWSITTVRNAPTVFEFEKGSTKIIFFYISKISSELVGEYFLNKTSATEWFNSQTKEVQSSIELKRLSKSNPVEVIINRIPTQPLPPLTSQPVITTQVETELDEKVSQVTDDVKKKLAIKIQNDDDVDSDDGTIDCSVCLDECKQDLECGHRVHMSCVARSGKAECPMCRKPVTLTKEFEAEYQKAVESNQRFIKEQQEQMSLDRARELQREQQQERHRAVRGTILQFPGRNLRLNFCDKPEHYGAEELMLGVSQLCYSVHTRTVTAVEVPEICFEVFQMLMKLNQIGMENNISTDDILNVLKFVSQ